jgi:hypothetical protein
MDLSFSADELAFRDELRGFIGNLPDDIRERMPAVAGRDAPLAAHLSRRFRCLAGQAMAGRAGLVQRMIFETMALTPTYRFSTSG